MDTFQKHQWAHKINHTPRPRFVQQWPMSFTKQPPGSHRLWRTYLYSRVKDECDTQLIANGFGATIRKQVGKLNGRNTMKQHRCIPGIFAEVLGDDTFMGASILNMQILIDTLQWMYMLPVPPHEQLSVPGQIAVSQAEVSRFMHNAADLLSMQFAQVFGVHRDQRNGRIYGSKTVSVQYFLAWGPRHFEDLGGVLGIVSDYMGESANHFFKNAYGRGTMQGELSLSSFLRRLWAMQEHRMTVEVGRRPRNWPSTKKTPTFLERKQYDAIKREERRQPEDVLKFSKAKATVAAMLMCRSPQGATQHVEIIKPSASSRLWTHRVVAGACKHYCEMNTRNHQSLLGNIVWTAPPGCTPWVALRSREGQILEDTNEANGVRWTKPS